MRWGIFERSPQDDPPVDRASLKLKRVALSVLVRPSCADFVPEGLLASLRDVPSQKVGCVKCWGSFRFLACQDLISFVWGGLLMPSLQAEGKGSEFTVNTAGASRWCEQAIDDRAAFGQGNRRAIIGYFHASPPGSEG